MEALPLDSLYSFAINIVTVDRVTDIGGMYSYLVGSTCFKAEFHQRILTELLQHLIMGNCVLGVLLCHAHFLSVISASADRCVNCAGRGL